MTDPQNVDLEALFGAGTVPNPLSTAAGCAGFGRELARFVPLDQLGTLTTRTVLPRAGAGQPGPRVVRTPGGLLNAIGHQNPGIDAFLRRDLPWLAERAVRTVVSIGGHRLEEFADLAGRLAGARGVHGLELNLSAPGAAARGLLFAANPAVSYDVVAAVKAAAPGLPVYAKLAPDTGTITEVAAGCVAAGADGLAMVNTAQGLAIDLDSCRPALAAGVGGLSGPALRPIAVRCVYQVHAAMLAGRMPAVPILAMGGVRTGRDALEFTLAGASGVAVGSELLRDPTAPLRILDELRGELAARDFTKYTDAVGLAHRTTSKDTDD
ncbi:dihydroorotate dehydrogenase [Streptomyces sp. TLI_171]|uniref:dihydroorotate dehydrogenase n=1 Tax=Streptomyces sp. TLI_171 TaxID=1938859 RepID=UPI000C186F7C|nr:dihydroorotate dehydrogenase [Streptomyces sp. TLI_171]RKE17998.1 dihydroorotate dehydrogenase (NAD+) catalytic subunit [Streptomyces sp. TLI_171]